MYSQTCTDTICADGSCLLENPADRDMRYNCPEQSCKDIECEYIFLILLKKMAISRPKVQELNSGTEASFSFFISNIFHTVKRKNIAFRMFLSQF